MDIEKLESILQRIEDRLDRLERTNINIQEDCSKMSTHIDFIDSIYDSVKRQLGYFSKRQLPEKNNS